MAVIGAPMCFCHLIPSSLGLLDNSNTYLQTDYREGKLYTLPSIGPASDRETIGTSLLER